MLNSLQPESTYQDAALPRAGVLSSNSRLEGIFHRNPGYLNRELTFPCRLDSKPIYNSPYLTPELEGAISQLSRTIILPHTFEALNSRQRSLVSTLASPYECGRVLEADREVLIDGIPYVITVKGIGCTNFYRQTGGDNPWMMTHHRTFNEKLRSDLERFPFLSTVGALHRSHATDQIAGVEAFEKLGVRTEKLLSVRKMTAMIDADANMRPIRFFKENGILDPELKPVLMFRAMQSNLRVLDPIMLDKIGQEESIAPLFEDTVSRWAKIQNVRPSIRDYCEWMCAQILRNELIPIVLGYEMSSGRWQDLGRNISLLGEELDLEDVKIPDFHHPNDYFESIKRHFHNTERVIVQLLDVCCDHTGECARSTVMADLFWNGCVDACKSEALKVTYRKLRGDFKKHYSDSFSEFQFEVFRSFSTVFVNWISCANNKGLLEFDKKMRVRFQKALGLPKSS